MRMKPGRLQGRQILSGSAVTKVVANGLSSPARLELLLLPAAVGPTDGGISVSFRTQSFRIWSHLLCNRSNFVLTPSPSACRATWKVLRTPQGTATELGTQR